MGRDFTGIQITIIVMSVESIESADILELTGQMLELAQSGEWERLFTVAEVRAQKISKMQFSANDRVAIEGILNIDEKIRELAQKERSGLLRELQKLSKAKNAINAYAS